MANSDYNFNFNFLSDVLKYGVKISYYDSQDVITKQLHYEMSINIRKKASNLWFFRFSKTNFRFNHKEPDLIVEKLAAHISNALSSFELEVNNSLELFGKVRNLQEIKNKWAKEKSIILKKYTGDTVNQLFLKVDNYLKNNTIIDDVLVRDWFFKLFFSPIYTDYNESYYKERDIMLPIFSFSNVFWNKGTLKILNKNSLEEDIKIFYSGKSMSNNEEKITDCKIFYDLNRKTKLIEHIRLNCEVFKGSLLDSKVKVSIHSLSRNRKRSQFLVD